MLWFFFLLCLAMGLAAWTAFWWSVRSGQLKDPEAAAGDMLEQDAVDTTDQVPAGTHETFPKTRQGARR